MLCSSRKGPHNCKKMDMSRALWMDRKECKRTSHTHPDFHTWACVSFAFVCVLLRLCVVFVAFTIFLGVGIFYDFFGQKLASYERAIIIIMSSSTMWVHSWGFS